VGIDGMVNSGRVIPEIKSDQRKGSLLTMLKEQYLCKIHFYSEKDLVFIKYNKIYFFGIA